MTVSIAKPKDRQQLSADPFVSGSSLNLCFHLITPTSKKKWGNLLIIICSFDRVHINDCLKNLLTLEVAFQLLWLSVLSRQRRQLYQLPLCERVCGFLTRNKARTG